MNNWTASFPYDIKLFLLPEERGAWKWACGEGLVSIWLCVLKMEHWLQLLRCLSKRTWRESPGVIFCHKSAFILGVVLISHAKKKEFPKFLENRGSSCAKTIKAMKTSWALDIFPESKTYTRSLHWFKYPPGRERGLPNPLQGSSSISLSIPNCFPTAIVS